MRILANNPSPKTQLPKTSRDGAGKAQCKELEDRFDQIERPTIQALVLRDMAQAAATTGVSEQLLKEAIASAPEASLPLPQLAAKVLQAAKWGLNPEESFALADQAHDSLQERGALRDHPLASVVGSQGSDQAQVKFLEGIANPSLPTEALALSIMETYSSYTNPTERFTSEGNKFSVKLTEAVLASNPAYQAEADLLAATEGTAWTRLLGKLSQPTDYSPLALFANGPSGNLAELSAKAALLTTTRGGWGEVDPARAGRIVSHFESLDLSDTDRKVLKLLKDVPTGQGPARLDHIGRHDVYNDNLVVKIIGDVDKSDRTSRTHEYVPYVGQQVENPQFKLAAESIEKAMAYPSSLPETEAWSAISNTPDGQDPVFSLAMATGQKAAKAARSLADGKQVSNFSLTRAEYNEAVSLRLLTKDAADPALRAAALELARQTDLHLLKPSY